MPAAARQSVRSRETRPSPWSRAHFFATLRHAALAFDDLRYPAKIAPKARLRRQRRQKYDADTFREGIKRWAADVGFGSLPGVSEAELVANLLDSLDQEDPNATIGRQRYSELSGVAHSGSFSVGHYASQVDRDGGLRTVELVAPGKTVMGCVAEMYLCTVRVTEVFGGYFQVPLDAADRWNHAKKTARQAFQRVRLWSSTGPLRPVPARCLSVGRPRAK